jgi:hypothetical protein
MQRDVMVDLQYISVPKVQFAIDAFPFVPLKQYSLLCFEERMIA